MLKRLFSVIFVAMVIFMMIGSSHAFVENIVAAWTFDEGVGDVVNDVSGNGNDGVIEGGAMWKDGRFGKALDFDGSTGYVEIPFDESMRVLNASDFTTAAWFMADDIPAENKEVFQQGDKNGTGRTWIFVHSTNEIRSFLGNATTGAGIGVEAGEWYHGAVVVTEDGANDTVQLYINGEIAGAALPQSMEDSEGSYFIGCHKDLTNFWDGIIDEVVLLNVALDDAQVQQLMNEGIEQVLAVKPTGKLAVCWGSVKDIR